MSDSRPLVITGVLFAVGLLVIWQGFSILSLERIAVGVAALALFSVVFIRTELGLYILIF